MLVLTSWRKTMPMPNQCPECELILPAGVSGICTQCKNDAARDKVSIPIHIEKDTGLHDNAIDEWWEEGKKE